LIDIGAKVKKLLRDACKVRTVCICCKRVMVLMKNGYSMLKQFENLIKFFARIIMFQTYFLCFIKRDARGAEV